VANGRKAPVQGHIHGGTWPPPPTRARKILHIALPLVLGLLAKVLLLPMSVFLLLIAVRDLAPVPQPEGQPQVLGRDALVGTWRDDRGGWLLINDDGTVDTHGACGEFNDELVPALDGWSGAWESDSNDGETSLRLTFDSYGWSAEYKAAGTREHPILWTYIGDRDVGDLCVLEHPAPRGGRVPAGTRSTP
jgi:hypothetical protein